MSADRLAVFARAPELGSVKSRLAATVGAEAALAAHCRLVEHTLGQVTQAGAWTLELWIAGDTSSPRVLSWADQAGARLFPQLDGDLGARMCRTLEAMLTRGSRAVLIGCDCPPIDSAYVRQAFSALDDHELVLGPAEDGGYGLIGVRGAVPGVFEDVAWGGDQVLARTLALSRAAGVRTALLAEIWDVDDETDWQRFQTLTAASAE